MYRLKLWVDIGLKVLVSMIMFYGTVRCYAMWYSSRVMCRSDLISGLVVGTFY